MYVCDDGNEFEVDYKIHFNEFSLLFSLSFVRQCLYMMITKEQQQQE